MPDPFYFGDPPRVLFGLRHCAGLMRKGDLLVCAPLLQEGIRCQRALWTLGQALASQGVETLRFDWYGSGDSHGNSRDIKVPGLVSDIALASNRLGGAHASTRNRMLALRSAALPLLLHAAASAAPVDVVLWAPVLDGRALVSSWREQHQRQLHAAGRFLKPPLAAQDDELLGFVLDDALLDALQALQTDQMTLPAGSRILLVQWQALPSTDQFMRRQTAAGVTVDCLQLDPQDEPDWDNPDHFETQIFPRRAVTRVATYLSEAA